LCSEVKTIIGGVLMKFAVFLFLISPFIITPNVYGQTMKIGARAGINLANENYENLPNDESISLRALFLGGAQFDYRLTNSIVISLQLLYDQKGAHAENGLSKADWTISYFEVPILAKIYFSDGAVRPYLFGGPSFGFLHRNSERLQTTINFPNGIAIPYSKDTVANITDSTSKFDFSIIAGAGISLTLTSGLELFLDAGYAFGLVNLDNYSADKGKDYYIYSRDVRIAAGILFPL